MYSSGRNSTDTLLSSDTILSHTEPQKKVSLTIPYHEIFSSHVPQPIEYLATKLGITPHNMFAIDPLNGQHKLEKRSVPMAMVFQLRNTLPSLRGRTIRYTTSEIKHPHITHYNQALSQHLTAIQLNQRSWRNVIDVIPRPILNKQEGYVIAVLSSLNSAYAVLSLALEGALKTLSAILDQPLRNFVLGRLQNTEVDPNTSRMKQFFKRASITLFKTQEKRPVLNGLKYGARAIYAVVASALFLIGLPLSLASNILSYTHQLVDSIMTLSMLPFRPISRENKKAVAWVAAKTFLKSAFCLIPTALTIGLLCTPAAPIIASALLAGNVATGITLFSLLLSAYAFISLRASGFIHYHNQVMLRQIDKKHIMEQSNIRIQSPQSIAVKQPPEPSYSLDSMPSDTHGTNTYTVLLKRGPHLLTPSNSSTSQPDSANTPQTSALQTSHSERSDTETSTSSSFSESEISTSLSYASEYSTSHTPERTPSPINDSETQGLLSDTQATHDPRLFRPSSSTPLSENPDRHPRSDNIHQEKISPNTAPSQQG